MASPDPTLAEWIAHAGAVEGTDGINYVDAATISRDWGVLFNKHFPISFGVRKPTQSSVKPLTVDNMVKASAARRGAAVRPKTLKPQRGPPRTREPYANDEIVAWLWDIITDYVDARVMSLLPVAREQAAKKRKLGKRNAETEALFGTGWPHSDAEWSDTAHALVSLLPSPTGEELTPMTSDACADKLVEYCNFAFDVTPDVVAIRNHIGPLCLNIEPSLFLTMTLARSQIMEEVIGLALGTELRSFLHSYIFEVAQVSRGSATQLALQELLDVRKQLNDAKAAAECGRLADVRGIVGPSKMLTSPKQTLATWQATKTRARLIEQKGIAEIVLKLNIGFQHAPKLFGHMRDLDRVSADPEMDVWSHLSNDVALREMVLTLEEAVEEFSRRDILKALDRYAYGL